jgi:hypothetical protein
MRTNEQLTGIKVPSQLYILWRNKTRTKENKMAMFRGMPANDRPRATANIKEAAHY